MIIVTTSLDFSEQVSGVTEATVVERRIRCDKIESWYESSDEDFPVIVEMSSGYNLLVSATLQQFDDAMQSWLTRKTFEMIKLQ